MESKHPIRILSDNYNFFVAISDCDIYLANVYWSEASSMYMTFAGTLSDTINYPSKREEVLRDWSKAENIVFIDGKFYFIAGDNFYVYGTYPKYFTKLYETSCTNNKENQTARLFLEIKKYLATCK